MAATAKLSVPSDKTSRWAVNPDIEPPIVESGVTLSVVLPETPRPAAVALIVVPPIASELARPCEPPALLIVATVVSEDAQVADAVRSCVELSGKCLLP